MIIEDVDDENMPEQGREDAQRLWKEERENSKRVSVEAKIRRRKNLLRRQGAENAQKDSHITQQPSEQESMEGTKNHPRRGKEHAGSSLNIDQNSLLDDSVVQFITAQEKKYVHDGDVGKNMNYTQPRAKRKKRPREKHAAKSSGRVQVVILNKDTPLYPPVNSAMEFKQGRLFGQHRQRSMKMLPKPKFSAAIL